jgi:hypothetical protein
MTAPAAKQTVTVLLIEIASNICERSVSPTIVDIWVLKVSLEALNVPA